MESGTVSGILEQISTLRRDTKRLILQIGDNPDITRLGPFAFSIPLSKACGESHSIMDPFYYDYKLQAQVLASIVDATSFERLLPTLQGIIKTGSYRIGEHKYKFHPVVLEHLEKIL